MDDHGVPRCTLPGSLESPLFPQYQPEAQVWSGLNLHGAQFLQVNTLTPNLPERERLAWHIPHSLAGVQEQKVWLLRGWRRNGQAAPRQYQLYEGKQRSSVPEASALEWCRKCPRQNSSGPGPVSFPEAIALTVDNNRWQQRKQQNLHSQ